MDRTARLAFVHRLLAAAGLAALSFAAFGCEPETRCFNWPEQSACPTREEAWAHIQACEGDDCVTSIDSDGFREDGLCCYEVTDEDMGCGGIFDECTTVEGRPLVVAGAMITAPVVRGRRDWAVAGAPDVATLDASTRARLAASWSRSAAMEHASIASFAKLALELLAFGAPADLVEDAQRASLDEARHARLAFALASAYAGEPIGPGPLPTPGSIDLAPDLVALARAAAVEGCIGETIAALVAFEELAGATDTAVRAALAEIAEDEARHAELAYRVVRWAIDVGGEAVRAAVLEVFAGIGEGPHRVASATPAADVDAALAAHGRLPAALEDAVRRRALREVIAPCGRALAGAGPAEAARGCAQA